MKGEGFALCLGQQEQLSLCWGVEEIKSELRHKLRGRKLGGGQRRPVMSLCLALMRIRQLAKQA